MFLGVFCIFVLLGLFPEYVLAGFITCMFLLVGRGDVQSAFFWKRASRDPSRLVAELSEVLRGSPHGETL